MPFVDLYELWEMAGGFLAVGQITNKDLKSGSDLGPGRKQLPLFRPIVAKHNLAFI